MSSEAMSADELRALALQRRPVDQCPCRSLNCSGWISLPGGFDLSLLRRVGRIGHGDPYEEPTHVEYHPDATRYESPDAPIAMGYYPYNRCDVWQCTNCSSALLRYTEFGGYYVDHRIRAVDPARVIEPAEPPPA